MLGLWLPFPFLPMSTSRCHSEVLISLAMQLIDSEYQNTGASNCCVQLGSSFELPVVKRFAYMGSFILPSFA